MTQGPETCACLAGKNDRFHVTSSNGEPFSEYIEYY